MAWTNPKTWAVGEKLTKALMDAQVRDNLNETAPAKAATAGRFIRVTGINTIEEADVTDGDKFDGDKLDIDWNPSNYTPDATPSEADDADDLTAHLKGIDDALGTNAQTQATQAAIEAETNENTYIPPDLIKYSPGVAKAWCQFLVTGSLQKSYNVDSITDNGTGDWTVNWDTNFSGAYVVVALTNATNIGTAINSWGALTAGAARFQNVDVDDGSTLVDQANSVHVVAFGDQ